MNLSKGPMCPVGYCNPQTAQPAPVPGAGDFCRRHQGKLSPPMAYQLEGARRRGDEREIRKISGEAIREARQLDDHWHPYAVIERGLAQGFENWAQASGRFFGLRGEELEPVMVSGRTGRKITEEQILCHSPWEIHRAARLLVDSRGLGHEGKASDLARALGHVYKRHFAPAQAWAEDIPPTCTNIWTGREFTWGEACELAQRGHR